MTPTPDPLTLAGPLEVLLSHMALLGTAVIVDAARGAGTARIRWTDEPDSRPQITGAGLSGAAIGELVHAHAQHHALDPAGFLHRVHPTYGSLFSARTKMPTTEQDWTALLHERAEAARPLRGLDSALTVGLGERAWWHRFSKTVRPDHGGAAWEMRTRNKGMEFVAHSLLPAGRAVAARAVAEVTSGLLGQTLRDEPGKDKADSRTATGLAPLGPADAARTWAALWAMAVLPVWAVTHGRSVSSAAVPPSRGRDGRLLMPVATDWITVPRMAGALRSRHLLVAVGSTGDDADPSTAAATRAAHEVLNGWGFAQVLAFDVKVSGSASAPERRTVGGTVVR